MTGGCHARRVVSFCKLKLHNLEKSESKYVLLALRTSHYSEKKARKALAVSKNAAEKTMRFMEEEKPCNFAFYLTSIKNDTLLVTLPIHWITHRLLANVTEGTEFHSYL